MQHHGLVCRATASCRCGGWSRLVVEDPLSRMAVERPAGYYAMPDPEEDTGRDVPGAGREGVVTDPLHGIPAIIGTSEDFPLTSRPGEYAGQPRSYTTGVDYAEGDSRTVTTTLSKADLLRAVPGLTTADRLPTVPRAPDDDEELF